ncbi:hypothetical protein PsorP6_007448 [Peronosclerospora sorghi]|uniref:Uncharacterized protein n=1 Tax=Peronosclerospora sorghi TaxID=230839 RepID=A0ACC0WAJ9_9STRA|nr:hypothetical protein PsorP6_007448 [Peronosclerospora sorghi]
MRSRWCDQPGQLKFVDEKVKSDTVQRTCQNIKTADMRSEVRLTFSAAESMADTLLNLLTVLIKLLKILQPIFPYHLPTIIVPLAKTLVIMLLPHHMLYPLLLMVQRYHRSVVKRT